MAEVPNITINLKQMRSDTPQPMTVPSNMSVDDFRREVSTLTNIPEDQIRLIFRGRALKTGQNLSDYSLDNGHTIQVVPGKPHSADSPNNEPPPPPPPNTRPHVTVRVVRHVSNGNGQPANVTRNPQILKNLCNIQLILSQLQVAATNLQTTILNENEQEAVRQLSDFSAQIRQKQIDITRETDGMLANSIQTTTTTLGDNPAEPTQIPNMPPNFNDILSSLGSTFGQMFGAPH